MEAAEWLVKLHAGDLSEAEQHALDTWRLQSVEHERVWRAALELKRTFGIVPADIGKSVLGRERLHRRAVLKTFAGLIAATLFASRYLPWREWIFDYHTATSKQREITLADGSDVMLNTDTAVDVTFTNEHRLITLHAGEILVETAPQARPLIVQTEQGGIRALGTRFCVRAETGISRQQTQVKVLEDAVEIRPANGSRASVLKAGQQTHFTRDKVHEPQAIQTASLAWSEGQIIADNQRLDDFVSELNRYRPGILRCDPAVADLRISGVFQIRDTDSALSIVEETLPVKLSYRTRYWVSIGPAE